MVEIEQVETDLAADIKIKSLSNIDPARSTGWCPDMPDEKCIFLAEEIVNFGDVVQFVGNNLFYLSLFTELPTRVASGLHNRQSWMIFGTHNVKPIKRGVKCEMYGNVVISMQNYLLELEPGCDSGHIQFYSLPEIARCDGQLYKRNSLMHVTVYRNRKVCRITPSLITVKPSEMTEKLMVAMLPGQRLQIITPANAMVDASTSKMKLVESSDKTLCHNTRISCTTFLCDELLDYEEMISVTVGRKRLAIWLAGLISSPDGGLYPCFNKPDCKTKLICHNMAGFAILDDTNPNWLIDDDIAEASQCDNGTIVKFAKPQKSVSIEQSIGYWWLHASQAHILDTQ